MSITAHQAVSPLMSSLPSSSSSSSLLSSSSSAFASSQSSGVSSISSWLLHRMATTVPDAGNDSYTPTTTSSWKMFNDYNNNSTTTIGNKVNRNSHNSDWFRFLSQSVHNNLKSNHYYNNKNTKSNSLYSTINADNDNNNNININTTHDNNDNTLTHFIHGNNLDFNNISIRSDISTTNLNYFILNNNNSASVGSVVQNFNNVTLNILGSVTGIGSVPPPTAQLGVRPLKWGMLALIIIILCTAVGNLLVCLAVCWERRLQNMTNYFLMSLAIADFLVALLVMPLGMVVAIYGYFPLNPEFCVLWATSDVLMCTASIWHMCTMSMDRFFTLKYPMRYGRNKTRKMVIGKILFVWLVSIAISCPIGIMGLIDRTAVFNDGVCVPSVENFVFYASIFAFYIPLCIMLVTYVLTIRILWKNQKRMKNIERSELKPKLAQLTAQCTGFAVPKLLNNIRKQQQQQSNGKQDKSKTSLRLSLNQNGCSSRQDHHAQQQQQLSYSDDRTALSSNYDLYEGHDIELGHEVKVTIPSGTNTITTTNGTAGVGGCRTMSYLPLPDPHPYLSTPSSRSVSPVSTSSCNYSLSSENDDDDESVDDENRKYVSLLRKSSSFRSLCSPPQPPPSSTSSVGNNNSNNNHICTKASSEPPPSLPKRRQRKLSYKERHKRLLQQQQQQLLQQQQQQQQQHQHQHLHQQQHHQLLQQQNFEHNDNNINTESKDNLPYITMPLISIDNLPFNSHHSDFNLTSNPQNAPNMKNNNNYNDITCNQLPTNQNNSTTTKGCESLKTIDALVNTFSLLSSPLSINWDSQRQLSSCPSSPLGAFNLTPSQHSLSLPGLSPANSYTTLLSTSNSASPLVPPPPEFKIQHPSTDSSSVSQLDMSKHSNSYNNNDNIATISNINRSNFSFGAFPNFNSINNLPKSEITSHKEIPCQLEVPCPGFYLHNKKNAGARTTSGPSLGGAKSDSNVCHTGLSAKTGGLGSFSLGGGSLSKDYKSMEWDRRYFQIQEEMDELLKESELDENHSEGSTTPDCSPLTTPKSVGYLTTGSANKEAPSCFFYSRSMPSSPENRKKKKKRRRSRKKTILTSKNSSSLEKGEKNEEGEEEEEEGNENEEEFSSSSDDDDFDFHNDDSGSKNGNDCNLFNQRLRLDDQNSIENFQYGSQEIHHSETDLVNARSARVVEEKRSSNDVIKICLHPPTSEILQSESSNKNEFFNFSSSLPSSSVVSSNIIAREEPQNIPESDVQNFNISSQFLSNISLNSPNNKNNSGLSESHHILNTLNPNPSGHDFSIPPPLSNTTSSSQIETNVASEADLTLEETDDTLDGNPTQDCNGSTKCDDVTNDDDKHKKQPGLSNDNSNSTSKHSHWNLFRKRSPNNSTKNKKDHSNKYRLKKNSSSSSFSTNTQQQNRMSNTFRMKTLGNSITIYGDDSQCDSNCSDMSSQNTKILIQTSHHHHHHHHHHSNHNNNNNGKNSSLIPAKHILSKKTASNEKKASKVLGIIFVVFVILWTPFFIMNISLSIYPGLVVSLTENAASLIVWLGYVASLANPIIYTMFNTAFRRTFQNILTCRLGGGHCMLWNSSARRRRGGGGGRGGGEERRRKMRRRKGRGLDRGGGGIRRPMPSYSTMVASGDRRNTVTLVLKDESR